MYMFNYRPEIGKTQLPLPFLIKGAGFYTPAAGFCETNAGELRNHCGIFWGKSGEAEFRINEKTYTLSANQLLYYYPYSSHRIRVRKEGFSYYWLIFDGPCAESMLRAFHFPESPFFAGPPPEEKLEQSMQLLASSTFSAHCRNMELLAALLGKAAAVLRSDAITTESSTRQLVERVKAIVSTQYNLQALTLNAIADKLQCHRTTITRALHKTLGVTPSQLIADIRLQAAIHLLTTTTLTAAEISEKCGFADPSHLSRKIRELTGLPPHRFRSQADKAKKTAVTEPATEH